MFTGLFKKLFVCNQCGNEAYDYPAEPVYKTLKRCGCCGSYMSIAPEPIEGDEDNED